MYKLTYKFSKVHSFFVFPSRLNKQIESRILRMFPNDLEKEDILPEEHLNAYQISLQLFVLTFFIKCGKQCLSRILSTSVCIKCISNSNKIKTLRHTAQSVS